MVAEFQNPEINPRRESENLWCSLSLDEALKRCPPFASAFFRELRSEFPAVYSSLRFMTWPGIADVYAFHDIPESAFGIQIDCDLEYIVIWSTESNGEHGDWGDGTKAQVQSALDHVRSLIPAA